MRLKEKKVYNKSVIELTSNNTLYAVAALEKKTEGGREGKKYIYRGAGCVPHVISEREIAFFHSSKDIFHTKTSLLNMFYLK